MESEMEIKQIALSPISDEDALKFLNDQLLKSMGRTQDREASKFLKGYAIMICIAVPAVFLLQAIF
jgi:hypothetical protein